MKLTATNIARLALSPGKTDEIVWDDELIGFGLRIRSGGSRKWIYQYRLSNNVRRCTIGTVGPMLVEEARKRARKIRVDLDDGKDPAAERASKRAASAVLLSTVIIDYLAVRRAHMKPRSYEATRYNLESQWRPFHGLAVGSLSRSIVAAHLRTLASKSGIVAANRARSALSALFGWAVGEGFCDANPVMGTNKISEGKPRERVLSDAELAAVWNAASDSQYGRIVKLLMLTAQRRDEIGGLCWSEIQGEGKDALIALSGKRTKNSRPHNVPLSPLARQVLDHVPQVKGRDLVFGEGKGGFSGWSRSKRRLDERLGAQCRLWTLHDLRRTAATRMADLGVAPHVIEAVLNHVSGHKGGVAGIYNRSVYAAEKRAGLDLWANYLEEVLARYAYSSEVQLIND